ncbi:KIR protein [Plasmodium coatneyi]|uniref:KIR protein n=1 Tax=Plasmodium coatneyi TaxID=208452 RepID=A0A1B1E3U2_9APIC|nr:KIR protein [Plasmodium coatneyi]ANQ09600.1 KIR protein [Plasmodium coatneyi]
MSETGPTVIFPRSLPSESNFLGTFNNDRIDNCDSSGGGAEKLGGTLRTALKTEYPVLSGSEEKITKAYCTACQWNQLSYYKREPCYFYYYWVGREFRNALNGRQLSDLLKKIYETLGNAVTGKKCEIIYKDVQRDIFNNREKIFHYSLDYSIVEKGLKAGNPNCDLSWSTYRSGVLSACTAVRGNCKTGPNVSGQYCKEFEAQYGAYCDIAKVIELYCKTSNDIETVRTQNEACSSDRQKLTQEKSALQSAQERIESEAKTASLQAEANLNKATTNATISSILGTLATIGAPFLLYKYKPWSSLFGNHSKGRRRGKRSAGSEIDTFTEASRTNSILDASENSTVRSAAYTRQATRESEKTNNNNTRGRGMVGYQNM